MTAGTNSSASWRATSRAADDVKLQSMSSDLVLRHVEDADRMAKEAFAGTGISVLTTGSGNCSARSITTSSTRS